MGGDTDCNLPPDLPASTSMGGHNTDQVPEGTVTSNGDTAEQDVIRELNQINHDDIDENSESQILTGDILQASAAEFRRAQRNDASLGPLWAIADADGSRFQLISGLLYRVAPPNRVTADGKQLVVPEKYHTESSDSAKLTEPHSRLRALPRIAAKICEMMSRYKTNAKCKSHVTARFIVDQYLYGRIT